LEISKPKINQKAMENKRKHASIEIRNAYRVRTVQTGLDEIAFGWVSRLGFAWLCGTKDSRTTQHSTTALLHQSESTRKCVCCVVLCALPYVCLKSLLVLW
jgi:hypothetical protein